MGDGNNAINAQHLFGGEVYHICGNLTTCESGQHILAIYEGVTREVQNTNAVLHGFKGLRTNHPLGIRGEGDVNGDIVTVGINLIYICYAVDCWREIPRGLHREVGVITIDLHTQGKGRIRHQDTDGA